MWWLQRRGNRNCVTCSNTHIPMWQLPDANVPRPFQSANGLAAPDYLWCQLFSSTTSHVCSPQTSSLRLAPTMPCIHLVIASSSVTCCVDYTVLSACIYNTIVSIVTAGLLCGECKDGKGVSALLNRCVDCDFSYGFLIMGLSKPAHINTASVCFNWIYCHKLVLFTEWVNLHKCSI